MTHRSIKQQQQQQGHYELTSVWTASAGEFCCGAARQSGERAAIVRSKVGDMS